MTTTDIAERSDVPDQPSTNGYSPGIAPDGEAERMEREATAYPAVTNADGETANAGDLPVILVNGDETLSVKLETAIDALVDKNSDGANGHHYYNRGGAVVWIAPDDGVKGVVTEDVTRHRMQARLSEVAVFAEKNKRQDATAANIIDPPIRYAQSVVELAPERLPRLDGIKPHPIMVSDAKGRRELITERGYRDGFLITRGVDVDELMPNDEAVGILRDLFTDFAFVDRETDFAHIIALALTPVIKPAVGNTPAFVIVKPNRGQGGTLAMETAMRALVSRRVGLNAPPTGGSEEENKAIFAHALNAQTFLAFDNVERYFGGSAINMALTSDTMGNRVLGKSETRTIKVSFTLAMSANGLKLTPDFMRRAVAINIARQVARPDGWAPPGGWTHKLPGDACDPKYRNALISLVANWILAGAPPASHETIGSYEGWSDAMAGILAHAGIRGFLRGRSDWLGENDDEQGSWEEMIGYWLETNGGAAMSASELAALFAVDSAPTPPFKFEDGESKARTRTTQMGRALSAADKRTFAIDDKGLFTLRRIPLRGNKKAYQLEPVEKDGYTSLSEL